jgi:hypothetical protein
MARRLPHEFPQMYGENRADRMDGVMSIEAFRHEAPKGADRDLLSERDLILDDGMDDGVHRQIW